MNLRLIMRMREKRRLKATEWLSGVFGMTAAACAVIGEVEQFSIYAVAAVFLFVLSRIR